ncbi:MAG: mercuric reductase [Pleurocapsa sp. SU_196_0]|nr:mercuric reductase [Pleurocapsa sp. SU_196_0]
MNSFDAIVIGAGQGGWPLARALATAGRRVALVERRFLGGTCVNDGCTPTKTLIASARVAHLTRRSSDYGVHASDVRVNLRRVRERVREQVTTSRGKIETEADKIKGLEVIHGAARFTAPKKLEVALNDGGTLELRAELIFVDTGTRNVIPDIDGLREVPFLDNTSILDLETLPEHLLVLGGGYIGLEFAQALGRLGSRVTVLDRGEQFLPKEDADISDALLETLRDEGVNVLLGAKVQSVRGDAQEVRLEGNFQTLHGSHLLVAVGRTPNTDTLNLGAAGIETDEKGFVRVDDALETTVSGVYALGDVKGGAQHTHIAYDDHRIVRDALLHGKHRNRQDRLEPYTIYTDPQLARVGLNERDAVKQGIEAVVYTLPMTRVARALETDETRGFMKALADDTGRILGATVLGVDGGEVLSVIQTAMMGKLTVNDLREAVYSHPSLSESLNNLFAAEPRALEGVTPVPALLRCFNGAHGRGRWV